MPRHSELDWDDLRYFLSAARAKTLAGSARALGVEHSTVGRRLAALERTVGSPLVVRGPDGLRLTLLGEKALPMVEEVDRAIAALLSLIASHRSRVRLAVPSGFTKILTPNLARLGAARPGLSLEMVSGSGRVDLLLGEADLAIRIGPVAEPDLLTRKLCDAGWGLYAAAEYLARRGSPADLEDFSGHDVIGYDTALSDLPAAKWLEARSHGANVVMRSREMVDMVTAAAEGVGLAVLACWMADGEPNLVRVTPEVVAIRRISLVYRRDAKQSPEIRGVIDFIVQVMREHAVRIGGVLPGEPPAPRG